MLKIGVLGAGHLGKIHLKLIKQIEKFELVGFFDLDKEKSAAVEKEFGVKAFSNMNDLIDAVDIVDVVTPSVSHFECAASAIKKSKHVFIEKPLASTLDEARILIELADEAGVNAMVGHVERFNPAFLAVKDLNLNPMFIETHRLAQFNPRGTDVAVVLDLMIHDIDLILNIVKCGARKVSASGVAVISSTPDIANARIEFENGCVANITCSRISMKQMRKIRLFQKDTYISMDLLEKSTEVFRLSPAENSEDVITIETGNGEVKAISYEKLGDANINSIKMELEHFAASILENKEPQISLVDGYNAMKLAHRILDVIEQQSVDKIY